MKVVCIVVIVSIAVKYDTLSQNKLLYFAFCILHHQFTAGKLGIIGAVL